jgi:hypothetical protein
MKKAERQRKNAVHATVKKFSVCVSAFKARALVIRAA